MRSAIALLVFPVLAATGCVYGPEHLDVLYQNRDAFQAAIDDVEARHQLEPRPGSRTAVDPKVAAADKELEEVREQLRLALDENTKLVDQLKTLEDPWFRGLSLEQQVQWRMHRDLLLAGARPEVRQSVEYSFGRTGSTTGTPVEKPEKDASAPGP